VSNISHFRKEDEVLFSMHAVFAICDIKRVFKKVFIRGKTTFRQGKFRHFSHYLLFLQHILYASIKVYIRHIGTLLTGISLDSRYWYLV
jgi:hypothetical protein